MLLHRKYANAINYAHISVKFMFVFHDPAMKCSLLSLYQRVLYKIKDFLQNLMLPGVFEFSIRTFFKILLRHRVIA